MAKGNSIVANCGFRYAKEDPEPDFLRNEGWGHKGPQLRAMWNHKFGGHHGGSRKDGYPTDIYIESEDSTHPILRGFRPYKDPRHVYILLLRTGQKSEGKRRMVYSSTCGADTLKEASARRLALQSTFWALRMESGIPAEGLKVDFLRPYEIPEATHHRTGDPDRGRPEDVFTGKKGWILKPAGLRKLSAFVMLTPRKQSIRPHHRRR